MKMQDAERNYMANHDLYTKVLHFINGFDYLAFLFQLMTVHVGEENAATGKTIYSEIYNEDFLYKEMTIANADLFVLDKSSQFREGIKRFVAIQDGDYQTILELVKMSPQKLSSDEEADLKKALYAFADVFHSMMGGYVRYYTKNTSAKNPQRLYYFEPDVDDSIMNFMTGMVLSNELISLPLKTDLLEMMRQMNLSYRNPLADKVYKPEKGKKIVLPEKSARFLEIVTALYAAIQNKVQVEIRYGIYAEENGKLSFVEKSVSVINPYALIWNNGFYYLISTSAQEKDKPRHYRMDRIISVRVVRDEKNEPVKRHKIPNSLLPYFVRERKDGREEQVFQKEKYVHEHPDMRIYQEKRLITCVFEVIDWELQMLVDAFGTDFTVKALMDEAGEPKTRLDYYGNDKQLYQVTVKDIQYENALSFALTHAEYITVRQPQSLVEDIKSWMQKMLDRLQ